ncbi:MAG: acyl-CoA reductase [Bacteroidota bacterium]
MELSQRINSFSQLGDIIRVKLEGFNPNNFENNHELWSLFDKARQKNPWFTAQNIKSSLTAIAEWLRTDVLHHWLSSYKIEKINPVQVGVIMAGNIPLVGFHDFLCVMMSGHSIAIKCSSDDDVLLPVLTEWLIAINPEWKNKIQFVNRLEKPGAVIATGSNNSARYFEYYFGKYPHIIRKNRNSVAVIDGFESKEDLVALGDDIFSYFGLGCRNVSKLYIPEEYSLNTFFQCMEPYADVMNHNKYMNNYDYHHALFLLNNAPFLTNNYLIVREHEALATPVSVLHYEYYKNESDLNEKLENHKDEIQCIAGHRFIPFGKTQQPTLSDYADGVDVMQFLIDLKI